MIEDIFKLVEAPVDRAGFLSPRSCRWGGLPKRVARRFSAHAALGVPVRPGTDRRWAGLGHINNPANAENGCSIQQRQLKHGSDPFTRNPMLGRASSPSRVRFAAQNQRALDCCGALDSITWLRVKGFVCELMSD
jgi:hypothetical protein